MSETALIRVEEVRKTYGGAPAVESASFTVAAGEIVGFLGPNGSGKSTLLRMLATYLAPDGGRIVLDGIDAARAAHMARARIGYLPEHNPLWEEMRVGDLLDFFGRIHGLAGSDLAERRDEVCARLELEPVLAKRVRECSKGFRQRIGIAGALIHDPPVLLLDEPTHGLDPLQVIRLRDTLRAIRAGRAILFSSHVLFEVVEIADRLLAVHRGRLVVDESLVSLRDKAVAAGVSLEALLAARLAGKEQP